ncbi:hypothetical protein B0T18DRAFT_456453, partial [Schizothecium vesticola]
GAVLVPLSSLLFLPHSDTAAGTPGWEAGRGHEFAAVVEYVCSPSPRASRSCQRHTWRRGQWYWMVVRPGDRQEKLRRQRREAHGLRSTIVERCGHEASRSAASAFFRGLRLGMFRAHQTLHGAIYPPLRTLTTADLLGWDTAGMSPRSV